MLVEQDPVVPASELIVVSLGRDLLRPWHVRDFSRQLGARSLAMNHLLRGVSTAEQGMLKMAMKICVVAAALGVFSTALRLFFLIERSSFSV
jgi:hypothetical protein